MKAERDDVSPGAKCRSASPPIWLRGIRGNGRRYKERQRNRKVRVLRTLEKYETSHRHHPSTTGRPLACTRHTLVPTTYNVQPRDWQNITSFPVEITQPKPLTFTESIGIYRQYHKQSGPCNNTVRRMKKKKNISFTLEKYFFIRWYEFLLAQFPRNRIYRNIIRSVWNCEM